MKQLGAKAPVAIVGYTFDGDWAARHRSTVDRFLDAARDAKETRAESEPVAHSLAPCMGVCHPQARAL